MGVRAPISKEALEKANERLDRQVGRLYTLWLVGILVGVVQIAPQDFSFGGVRYTIKNPDVIQGAIFFGCLLYYLGIFAYAITHVILYAMPSVARRRRLLYGALGKNKTLAGRTLASIRGIKGLAKFIACIGQLFIGVVFFTPFVHIVFLEQKALLQGADAIFGTTSIKDGTVVLSSGPVIAGTAIILLFLTLYIFGWMVKRSEFSYGTFLSASGFAILLMASAEWFFRGQETFTQGFNRVLAIGVLIVVALSAIWLVIVLMNLFQAWRLRRWRAKLAEIEKQRQKK